jgi:hypothetical protein
MMSLMLLGLPAMVLADNITYTAPVMTVPYGTTSHSFLVQVMLDPQYGISNYGLDLYLTKADGATGKVSFVSVSAPSSNSLLGGSNFIAHIDPVGSEFDASDGIPGQYQQVGPGTFNLAQVNVSIDPGTIGTFELKFYEPYCKMRLEGVAVPITPARSAGSITVSAVPEPSTLAMLSGLVVLPALVWRRCRRTA